MGLDFRTYKPFERDILGLPVAGSGNGPGYVPSSSPRDQARDFQDFEEARAAGLVSHCSKRGRSE